MSYILRPVKTGKVTRGRAFALHLLISLAIAASALALLLLVWYPGPLFEAAGGFDLLLILVGIDVIVGPLITLIIFRPGKRGLKFDLVAIGVVQLAALVYGVHIMFLARPAFIVFVKDRFEIATAVELEAGNLAAAKWPQFSKPPITGPLLAAADFPTDPDERNRQLDLALAGFDLHHFPKYYVPYAKRAGRILERAQTVARTRAVEPVAGQLADAYLAQSGRTEDSVRYLDLRAPRAWMGVLIDAKTAEPVKMFIYEEL
jgi:hypothetical protein